MKAIWKYTLDQPDSAVTYKVPTGGTIVHVAQDPGAPIFPAVWILVDTNAPRVPRAFRFVGTGHEIPEGGIGMRRGYHGAAACGPFMWHVFEVEV